MKIQVNLSDLPGGAAVGAVIDTDDMLVVREHILHLEGRLLRVEFRKRDGGQPRYAYIHDMSIDEYATMACG